jgi:hypothetical protein
LSEEEFGPWAVKVNAGITFVEYTLTFLVSMAAMVTFIADRFPVAGQARIDLLLSWRNAFTTAKTRQWRKTASTVRPRNMDTARAVTGLTVPGNCGRAQDFRLAVHTGLNRMHLWPRVAQQASFSPLSGIAGHAFSFLYAVRILRKNNSA